ncbi:hypothetical protein [Streptomyces caniscabiei]|uniref:Uncharacterized protein n=1 Tax=Streptomyces caniscabiei TaxID=2746961 RepID=A0ABU4N278_9ACTN|nr:hypothetical protein [Streptomyces caniscabiei]MBE4741704.1 hypothetical protein [Streptomyces caniscabiei]MBE4762002.1 hypothetical protein [Streptomyces caniscabiei]MBE4790466.1 hypothetical protein [Streptomyces caniscabiei]MBE4799671.1 hypothetical protein [Streptomyces caniscabiei]MDX2948213.1 hypothetical protein [Streptomyces caniscabiei]
MKGDVVQDPIGYHPHHLTGLGVLREHTDQRLARRVPGCGCEAPVVRLDAPQNHLQILQVFTGMWHGYQRGGRIVCPQEEDQGAVRVVPVRHEKRTVVSCREECAHLAEVQHTTLSVQFPASRVAGADTCQGLRGDHVPVTLRIHALVRGVSGTVRRAFLCGAQSEIGTEFGGAYVLGVGERLAQRPRGIGVLLEQEVHGLRG